MSSLWKRIRRWRGAAGRSGPPALAGELLEKVPTSNLLCDLRDHCGVAVRVLACQTGPLPDEVRPGLSAPVLAALPAAAEWVTREYFGEEACPATAAPS